MRVSERPAYTEEAIVALMLDELNAAQREAVETSSGPLLVLAGAGTGKTRVVTHRIARLIAREVPADRILAVTFTNKAAAEMQRRVAQLLGRKTQQTPRVSTFHSLCVKILRRHIHLLGYPSRFVIYTRGDQESVARRVLGDIHVPSTLLRPSDLISYISQWKSKSLMPPVAASQARSDREHLAAAGYRRYTAALAAAGAVDFDDLLLKTEELFRIHVAVRCEEAMRFDHILVDEYQDTNPSQYRIVKTLAAGHRNLCVVGDDDQSIYGWRGADVGHILRFRDDWPDAKVIRLEVNYRSTSEILKMANQLIVFNKGRYEKQLKADRRGGTKPRIVQYPDETTEANAVVADIRQQLANGDCQPREIAVLFRTNEQPRLLETELRRARLPYVLIGGMSFFDRKEVRDVVAYLNVLDSPHDDVSLLRICNTPPRSLGPKTMRKLMEEASRRGVPLWDLCCATDHQANVPADAVQSLQEFTAMIEQFRQRLPAASLADLAQDLIRRVGYQEEIRRSYNTVEEHEARWAIVEEMINALAAYQERTETPTLREFLDEITLSDRDFDKEKENQLRRNAIALMTLHSAKGLEFPHVYLVGMEEGIVPHRRSLAAQGDAVEEERRLCYVGITRARDRLTLSLALSRRKWGKPRPTQASRFLFEMTGNADRPRGPDAAAPAEMPNRSHRRPAPGQRKPR
jgi:DNA helicase-2/ATP-dependent DNA helicase PcrA